MISLFLYCMMYLYLIIKRGIKFMCLFFIYVVIGIVYVVYVTINQGIVKLNCMEMYMLIIFEELK